MPKLPHARSVLAGASAPVRLILRWLFGSIHYPAPQAEQIQALNESHVLIYVTRGHSSWAALSFCHVIDRMRLPGVAYVGGIDLFWLQPLRRLWLALRRRLLGLSCAPLPQRVAEALGPRARISARAQRLAERIAKGQPTLVVLPPPRRPRAFLSDFTDLLQLVLAIKADTHKKLVLLPHVLVAREQSGTARGMLDRFFGDTRRPGLLRYWSMLLTLRNGSMRLAEPIVLDDVQTSLSPLTLRAHARRLRFDLHRVMDEEERVVAGPLPTAYDHVAKAVLQASDVRNAIVEAATQTGLPEPYLEAQAASHIKAISARYNVRVIGMMESFLYLIFHRLYDGMATDEYGLNKVIEASRKAPIIFCPSHKSHIDYLVLSFVLWRHGIAPPHIAAGANLSFFPLGLLFRRCGAFFLRRSFRDDPVYGAVLRSYIYTLLRQGTSLEFFLEGTRSRTGKLLPPRFGLLSMVIDAWRKTARDDLVFVPVSIDYERIIEAKTYERELGGAAKKAEDFSGLLRAPSVLRSRYGRVQVQFGEPISVAQWAKDQNLAQDAGPEHDAAFRKSLVKLGWAILHEVAKITSVTPTCIVSTVLLAHPGRGMAQGILLERSLGMLDFLDDPRARLSETLIAADTRVAAILEAVNKLCDDKAVIVERAGEGDVEPIYRVDDTSRLTLDYHKNAIMNAFAPSALVARSLARRMSGPIHVRNVQEDALFLSHLLKREFIFRSDGRNPKAVGETLDILVKRQWLSIAPNDTQDATITLLQPDAIGALAHLIDSFVQAYWIVLNASLDLRAIALPKREFIARALQRARRAFLEGEVTRPEAASHTLCATASDWLESEGLLKSVTQSRRSVLALAQDESVQKIRAILDDLKPFI